MKKEFYDVYIAASMTGCKDDNEYEKLRNKIINLKKALIKQDPELKVFYAGDDIESLNQVSELSDINAANVVMDVENIFDAQYFLLIYPEKSCSSTLVETGCALSSKKKSLYCVKNKNDLPYMLKHSPEAYPFIKISTYKSIDEITEKINKGIDIFSDFYSEIKKEIKENKWDLKCPVCGQSIKYKILPCSNIKLLCNSNKCNFTIKSQILWYNMSVLNIKEKVLKYGIEEDKALNWAYTLKYTHPSYKYSQKNEREQTKLELSDLFKNMIKNKNIKDMGILLVGSNSCIEMESFPYRFNKSKFWGIDLSESLVNIGKNNSKYKECNFKVTSIENLYNNSDIPKNSFELVIALRVIQSRMDMHKTLNSISDALKLGGKAIISIPKQTSMIEVNCKCKTESGIIKIDSKTGKVTDTISSSLNEVEIMVAKIKDRNEFTNVSVFYGSLSSMEYYITFEKKL